MSDEKKEKWTTWLAISTVVIVVCATLSTFKGGGYSNKSLMNQTSASDQWSFYQSKSMKGYNFEMQKDNLELQSELVKKSAPDLVAKYQAKVDSYAKKIQQYESEKVDIMKKAKEFEALRDDAKRHASAFGMAVIFLQISILLSSISALAHKKYVWLISLGVGVIGIFYFIDGFLLFLK
jgi:hypothetical protein